LRLSLRGSFAAASLKNPSAFFPTLAFVCIQTAPHTHNCVSKQILTRRTHGKGEPSLKNPELAGEESQERQERETGARPPRNKHRYLQ
jgi:hypothetical protein